MPSVSGGQPHKSPHEPLVSCLQLENPKVSFLLVQILILVGGWGGEWGGGCFRWAKDAKQEGQGQQQLAFLT